MAPRLSTRQKKQIEAGGPGPREPGIGDNRTLEERKADQIEAERVQLISFVSRLSQADGAIEVAKGPLKAAQEARKKIIGLAKGAGFTAKRLEARIAEMNVPTREMARIVEEERRDRRALGTIDADQERLQLGQETPEEAKDEAHWKGEGYKAGLRMMEPKPPKECPERFTQPWMLEFERGFGESTAANAPKQTPKPVRQQAADDFADDQEAEIKRAAAELKQSGFMERGEGEPVV